MNEPEVATTYKDTVNRSFNVQEINIGDLLGREVIGVVWKDVKGENNDYSCTLRMWEEIWRDRVPRANPEKMKIG